MPRTKQVCIKLSDEEFFLIQKAGKSPHDILVSALNGENAPIAPPDIKDSTNSTDIPHDDIQDNESKTEYSAEDLQKAGNRGFHDAISGEAKNELANLGEADEWSDIYNEKYQEGLAERSRREEARKNDEERRKKARGEAFYQIVSEAKNFEYGFHGWTLGEALREKGIQFSDLDQDQKRIIFQGMNDNADLVRTVKSKIEDFAQGIGAREEDVVSSYNELSSSLMNPPLWG